MSYSAAVLADNPWFFFQMDETSGTALTNDGSNGVSANWVGTTALNEASLLPNEEGASALFDGTSTYYQLTTVTGHAAANAPFVFECWFKTTSATYGTIVDKGNSDGAIRWLVGMNNGIITMYQKAGGLSDTINTTGTYNDGEAHHLVAVFDRSATKLGSIWVDGVLVKQAALTATATLVTSEYLRVGWNAQGNGIWTRFDGHIDNVAYYNATTIPDASIEAHYAAGVAEGGVLLLYARRRRRV